MAHVINSTHSINGRRNGAARRAVKSRAGDVVEDIEDLRKDISKLATAVSKAARAEADSASDQIRGFSHTIKSRARDGASHLHDQVRAHPAAALGASLGIGLIVGMALTARR